MFKSSELTMKADGQDAGPSISKGVGREENPRETALS
jgi:hypothetical protein